MAKQGTKSEQKEAHRPIVGIRVAPMKDGAGQPILDASGDAVPFTHLSTIKSPFGGFTGTGGVQSIVDWKRSQPKPVRTKLPNGNQDVVVTLKLAKFRSVYHLLVQAGDKVTDEELIDQAIEMALGKTTTPSGDLYGMFEPVRKGD